MRLRHVRRVLGLSGGGLGCVLSEGLARLLEPADVEQFLAFVPFAPPRFWQEMLSAASVTQLSVGQAEILLPYLLLSAS